MRRRTFFSKEVCEGTPKRKSLHRKQAKLLRCLSTVTESCASVEILRTVLSKARGWGPGGPPNGMQRPG